MKISAKKVTKIIGKVGWDKCVRVEVDGYVGGIWIIWKGDNIFVKVIAVYNQFVLLGVEDGHQSSWLFTTVYVGS